MVRENLSINLQMGSNEVETTGYHGQVFIHSMTGCRKLLLGQLQPPANRSQVDLGRDVDDVLALVGGAIGKGKRLFRLCAEPSARLRVRGRSPADRRAPYRRERAVPAPSGGAY